MLKKDYREHMESCPDRAVVESMISGGKEFIEPIWHFSNFDKNLITQVMPFSEGEVIEL